MENLEHIRRWKMPRDYAGAEWPEYYVSATRNRDSGCLEESNFFATLRALGGESDTVRVVRESHWAVGWVEWVAVHDSDAAALAVADSCAARIADYPILDENDFSERESEQCDRIWSDCFDWRERVKYFRRHSHGGDFRGLLAAVRGDWHAAANALNCPSDLLA